MGRTSIKRNLMGIAYIPQATALVLQILSESKQSDTLHVAPSKNMLPCAVLKIHLWLE